MDGSTKLGLTQAGLPAVTSTENGTPLVGPVEPIRTVPIDYVRPPELLEDVITAASLKAGLSVKDLVIRGFLAGAFLGFATILAFTVRSQGLPTIVDALIFPAGFVLLVLLGFELVTGNFAILPVGVAAKHVSVRGLLRTGVRRSHQLRLHGWGAGGRNHQEGVHCQDGYL